MEKAKLKLRAARLPNEIDTIMDIWYEATIRAHDFMGSNVWTNSKTDMRLLYAPDAEILVAEENQKILGFAIVKNEELAALYVDPRVQSSGVGQQLLDELLLRHHSLNLRVYSDNLKAKSFYEKNGFKMVKEEKDPETEVMQSVMVWNREA